MFMGKKLTLHKELNYLSPSNVRTMWVSGSRVRTTRRGAATGVRKFQGGPKFCFQKGSSRLIRKKNAKRKIIKKFAFERRLETPVVRLSYKNKI